MSEASQGEDWWQASNGRWYPPSAQPGTHLPPPPDEFSDGQQDEEATDQEAPGKGQPDSSRRSRRDIRRRRRRVWTFTGAAVLLLVVIGIVLISGGGDTSESERAGDTPTTVANELQPPSSETTAPLRTTTSSTTSTTSVPEPGSEANPFALGETTTIGDWEVTVLSFQGDATQDVLNDRFLPPLYDLEPGWVYSIVRLRLTYVGSGTGLPWGGVSYGVFGTDGRVYDDSTYHPGAPDGVDPLLRLTNGGTVEGNYDIALPQEQVPPATTLWLSSGFDGPIFWSVA